MADADLIVGNADEVTCGAELDGLGKEGEGWDRTVLFVELDQL